MLYNSTRGNADPVDFTGAMLGGLAPDGGLYVPETTPTLPDQWRQWDYKHAIAVSLTLFGATQVEDLVAEAVSRFHHQDVAPIVEVGDRLVLELFWGPTLSFKDHALQVLGRLLARESRDGTILGATSGDTGSAAIEACRGFGLRVVILYPQGMVSEFQRRQMTTVDDANVTVVAVRGTFDDCQALVKNAFASTPGLLAINSINWARIAAQVGYYIHAATRIGEPFDVAVPTGNFGNVLSCWTAKRMGVPIETITIANNANHALTDLVRLGRLGADPVRATLAPAMDIAIPSNLERFTGDPQAEFKAGWSTDAEIEETIADTFDHHAYRLDPHTATAWRAGAGSRTDRPQLVVATAHPAKFSSDIAPPDWYADLSALPEREMVIDPDPSDLAVLLR